MCKCNNRCRQERVLKMGGGERVEVRSGWGTSWVFISKYGLYAVLSKKWKCFSNINRLVFFVFFSVWYLPLSCLYVELRFIIFVRHHYTLSCYRLIQRIKPVQRPWLLWIPYLCNEPINLNVDKYVMAEMSELNVRIFAVDLAKKYWHGCCSTKKKKIYTITVFLPIL